MQLITSLSFDEFLIHARRGKFFSVTFIKRTNGEERNILCRVGVKKHLHGGELRYNPIEKNLLGVYDMRIEDYRNINLDGLLTLTIGHRKYTWDAEKRTFYMIGEHDYGISP